MKKTTVLLILLSSFMSTSLYAAGALEQSILIEKSLSDTKVIAWNEKELNDLFCNTALRLRLLPRDVQNLIYERITCLHVISQLSQNVQVAFLQAVLSNDVRVNNLYVLQALIKRGAKIDAVMTKDEQSELSEYYEQKRRITFESTQCPPIQLVPSSNEPDLLKNSRRQNIGCELELRSINSQDIGVVDDLEYFDYYQARAEKVRYSNNCSALLICAHFRNSTGIRNLIALGCNIAAADDHGRNIMDYLVLGCNLCAYKSDCDDLYAARYYLPVDLKKLSHCVEIFEEIINKIPHWRDLLANYANTPYGKQRILHHLMLLKRAIAKYKNPLEIAQKHKQNIEQIIALKETLLLEMARLEKERARLDGESLSLLKACGRIMWAESWKDEDYLIRLIKERISFDPDNLEDQADVIIWFMREAKLYFDEVEQIYFTPRKLAIVYKLCIIPLLKELANGKRKNKLKKIKHKMDQYIKVNLNDDLMKAVDEYDCDWDEYKRFFYENNYIGNTQFDEFIENIRRVQSDYRELSEK